MSRGMMFVSILCVALSMTVILRWQRDVIIRWICPSEILFLDTIEARYRVHGRGLDAFLRDRRTWIAVITYSVVFILISAVLGGLIVHVTSDGQWSVTGVRLSAVLGVVIPLQLIPVIYVRYRKWMRVFLHEYLNDHGIPVCQGCGYDLRGQVDPRCPECGREFALRDPGIEGAHPVNGGG